MMNPVVRKLRIPAKLRLQFGFLVACVIPLHGCIEGVKNSGRRPDNHLEGQLAEFDRVESKDRAARLLELGPVGFSNIVALYERSDSARRSELLVDYFSKLADPGAVAILEEAARSSDPKLRACSVPYISWDEPIKLSAPTQFDNLSPNEAVVLLSAMHRTGGNRLATVASEAAKSPDTWVRRRIASLLLLRDSPQSRKLLMRLSQDKDKWVRANARLGLLVHEPMQSEASRQTEGLLRLLTNVSPGQLVFLGKLCRLERPEVRKWVATRLIRGKPIEKSALAFSCRFLSPDRELRRSLTQLATDPNAGIRMQAVSSLAVMGDRELLDRIKSRLPEDDQIAWAYAYALRKLESGNRELLIKYLQSKGPARFEAMIRLAQLGVPSSRYQETLKGLMSDARSPQEAIRMRAAYVARQLGDPEAVKMLEVLQKDPLRSVRAVARFGRLYLEAKDSHTSLYEDAIAGWPELGFFDATKPRNEREWTTK